MVNGVSVVICTHNSRDRIAPTLAHLAAQQVPASVDWELLLIDNASTDATAAVAHSAWSGALPLRVIHEPKLGLSHARWRGIHEAQYEIVCFVDDDNWLAPDWVATAAAIMSEHPEVGACGGYIEPVCEQEPPPWFSQYAPYYANTPKGRQTGYIDPTRQLLSGAGLTVRREAMLALEAQGFTSLLTGRKGASLSGGEDYEICLVLYLVGWLLWFDNRLSLQHFMPSKRLEWNYLRRLTREGGIARSTIDSYRLLLTEQPQSLRVRLRYSWQGQVALHLQEWLRNPKKVLSAYLNQVEGNPDTIWMEWEMGHLTQILKYRTQYRANIVYVQKAKWLVSGSKPVKRQAESAR